MRICDGTSQADVSALQMLYQLRRRELQVKGNVRISMVNKAKEQIGPIEILNQPPSSCLGLDGDETKTHISRNESQMQDDPEIPDDSSSSDGFQAGSKYNDLSRTVEDGVYTPKEIEVPVVTSGLKRCLEMDDNGHEKKRAHRDSGAEVSTHVSGEDIWTNAVPFVSNEPCDVAPNSKSSFRLHENSACTVGTNMFSSVPLESHYEQPSGIMEPGFSSARPMLCPIYLGWTTSPY